MSYEVSFFGKLIPTDQFAQAYQFEMIDIFVPQHNKWLKKDSFAASKLYTNMEVLKASKSFAFATTEGSTGNYFKDAATKSKSFRLIITAYIAGYKLLVVCYDCELKQSLLMPTPIGTAQGYELKFKNADLKQEAVGEPLEKGSARGPGLHLFPDPWGLRGF